MEGGVEELLFLKLSKKILVEEVVELLRSLFQVNIKFKKKELVFTVIIIITIKVLNFKLFRVKDYSILIAIIFLVLGLLVYF